MTLRAREREILGATERGLRNKAIVRHLNIGDGTVPFHTQTIACKFDVAIRTEPVGVAYRQRIVAVNLPLPSVSNVA